MNLYQRFIRVTIWFALRLMYRIQVKGIERIPMGPAILAPNHVTYIDAVLIAAHIRRPVYFAMHWKIFKRLGWLVEPLGAFPIASKEENAVIYREAFATMERALHQGDLVCIFPEGMLTLDGSINPFRSGVKKLVDIKPVPVVPVALKGLWGTYFSKRRRKVKLPDRWMSKIKMEFGYRLDARDIDALEKRLRVMHAGL